MSVETLEQENTQLKQQLFAKEKRIAQLEELIRGFNQKQFGASSEQSPHQAQLFDEAEAYQEQDSDEKDNRDDTIVVPAHTRQKQRRVSIPADIPREDIIYDLTDAQKVCPKDGTTLKQIGEAVHEQLDIVPAKVTCLRHVRLKYGCPCCEQHIISASKPKQAIEKSMAAPGLLAYIAVSKYADALPLYRQSVMFKRLGIELDRTSLSNWMIRCGQLVQPLINRQHDQLMEHSVIHMDETPVQVLSEAGKAPQSKSYMWTTTSTQASLTPIILFHYNASRRAQVPQEQLMEHSVIHMDETPVQVLSEAGKAPQSKSYMWTTTSTQASLTPIILFHYNASRRAQVPQEQLEDYQGTLMVDGYEGYQAVCTQNHLTRLGCWAHARRKFIEAKQLQAKNKTGKADQALAYIQKLYAIEKLSKDKPPDERYNIRQQQAKPIIDKLHNWLEKQLPRTPPKTAIGKALHYLHKQWPRLIAYLEDGDYPIDNNRAENAIRPFVIGRKNWLFSASVQGAKASANLYSLIETAKANQLEPYAYLKQVFTQLPNAQTIEEVDQLLPWNTRV